MLLLSTAKPPVLLQLPLLVIEEGIRKIILAIHRLRASTAEANRKAMTMDTSRMMKHNTVHATSVHAQRGIRQREPLAIRVDPRKRHRDKGLRGNIVVRGAVEINCKASGLKIIEAHFLIGAEW